MKRDKEYIIHFGNLKIGKHVYNFHVDRHFFEEYPYSLVKNGDISVTLILDKEKETLLVLDFSFKGEIEVECDRCLDNFNYPVNNTARILVKLTDKEEESNDDEMIYLPVDAWDIDVKPVIYEFINLQLPLRTVCSLVNKECNPEVITYLKNQEEKADDTDPRWAGLEGLKEDEDTNKNN